ncbi:MAG: GNAT family N-acetyltransferase [Gemmatimonadetes bacterium]|nr:GNAT family N-acetyltransferase [Gemmatimonadota bacterium]MBI3568369.1 GNAT family N-acetyltransferase [Gemmatimonadota bacterium]
MLGGARFAHPLQGPLPIGRGDIGPLNVLFSDAFTERYRRDGLVGVRVPPLNPMIWRYAIDAAGDGAMCWRDPHGALGAFNIAHRSGIEGWMGPLAVRDDLQGEGHGKTVVGAGIDRLQRLGCRVIGLETMPRTMDNIGFYATLGFVPGHLTTTLTVEASEDEAPATLSSLGAASRDDAMRECAALADALIPGYDFSREIVLTASLGLGDTVLLYERDDLAGFALCHWAPLVEGRSREELRVLKMVLRDEERLAAMIPALAALARRAATARAAVRVQGAYGGTFRRFIAAGARVRWTDLRMSLAGYAEPAARDGGIVLSNWEI